MLEVAKKNSNIEQDDPTRKPLVRFQNFGDSTLNFALVAWIKNVIKIRQINSDLHHQVFEKLREENIVIAFPQRDVHFFDQSKVSQPLSKDIDDNLAPETTNRVEDLEGDEETKKLLEEIESRNSE